MTLKNVYSWTVGLSKIDQLDDLNGKDMFILSTRKNKGN